MDMDAYAREARALAEDLHEMAKAAKRATGFPPDNLLHKATVFHGERALRSLPYRLVRALPADRDRQLARMTPPEQTAQLMVAGQAALHGAYLLEQIDQHLQPGIGYREMLARAAALATRTHRWAEHPVL